MVGISYRQLDYWARTGLVTPSVREAGGSGTQRLYSFQDLVQLRVMKKLLDAGVSLQKIRKAIGFLQEHMDDAADQVTLMSDGRQRLRVSQSEDEIIDLLKRGPGRVRHRPGPGPGRPRRVARPEARAEGCGPPPESPGGRR